MIDALYNKGLENVQVKTTTSSDRGVKSEVTDAGGFASIGPFVPGEEITLEISQNGFDAVNQVFTAQESMNSMMVGLNPTVNSI